MSYSAQAASSSHSSPSSSSSINHNSPNHTHSSTSKSKSRKSIQPVETEEEKLRRLERLEIEHRSKIRSQEARDRFVTYIRAKVAPRNVAGIADAIDEAMARFDFIERQLQTLEAQSTKQSIAMKQYEELAQRLNAENQALLQTVCSLRAECQNQQPSTPAGPYYSSMISATYQMPHSYPAIHRPTPVYGFSTSSFGSI